jgi:iron(III) transport system ATP-binding protein
LLENGQTIQLNEYTKDALTIKPDGMKVKVMMDTDSIIIYNAQGEVLN